MIWLLFACTGEAPSVTKPTSEPCDACGGECLDESTPTASRNHTDAEVPYESWPPSTGDHDPCWSPWGVFTEPVRTENWVHNLEHGGVVFLYTSALSAEDLATLTVWVESLPEGRAILTPAEEPMDATVAAVAWEHRLLLGCFDGAALDDFFWDHVAHAPEDITSGPSSSCTTEDSGA